MDTEYNLISTANIYDLLLSKWKDNNSFYSKELFREIRDKIVLILHKQNVKPQHDWQSDLGGLFEYVFNSYPRQFAQAQTPDYFPIPEYVVFHDKAGAIDPETLSGQEKYYERNLVELLRTYTIINLEDDSYIISRNDMHFDFFFAVQLSLIDIMEMKNFLHHHFTNSFDGNEKEYIDFLQAISVKHKKFLGDEAILMISNFDSGQIHNAVVDGAKEDVTLRKKVLALKYLFDELNINNDKIAMAEFIKLVTGKEPNQVTKDGNIYKWLKNPFPTSDKVLNENLMFIRPYFEKLGLTTVVDRINKEITTNDKNLG